MVLDNSEAAWHSEGQGFESPRVHFPFEYESPRIASGFRPCSGSAATELADVACEGPCRELEPLGKGQVGRPRSSDLCSCQAELDRVDGRLDYVARAIRDRGGPDDSSALALR